MKTRPFPKRFFGLLVGDILRDHDYDVEFRCTSESMPVRQFFCASMKQIQQTWPSIQELNQNGYDVSFTVVPRLRKASKGKREHALPSKPTIAGLWADLDVGKKKPYPTLSAALRRVIKERVRPSIIVESGGGLHAYYVFPRPVPLREERLHEILSGLARRLKGDSMAARCRRLMRVPNTYNHKYRPSRRCRVQYLGTRWTLKQLRRFCDLPKNGKVHDEPPSLNESVSAKDFFDLFRPHVERLTRGKDEWARGMCPIHRGKNPSSFAVNMRTGRWVCYSCGRDGGWSEFKRAAGISVIEVGGNGHFDLTWDTLPRFDPAATRKTRWLADHLIADRTISLAFGPRGSFKSTFFLALAQAVAKGEEFLGLTTRKRKILYLDYENPPDVIKTRDQDLHLNLPANKNLVIWDRFSDQTPPRPGDARLEKFVRHCVKKLHRKPWIILDSWSSLLRPGDGGETTGQIAPIYAHLRHLCDLGATVTVLDHTRKYDQDTIYGGQDKEAKADTIHNFTVHENKPKPENPILRVQSWLKRYAPQGVGTISTEIQSRKDGEGVWHITGFKPVGDPLVEEKARNRQMLRRLIKHNPTSSQRELARLATRHGMGRDQAERMLKDGIDKYWVVREGANSKLTYRVLRKT